MPLKRQNIDTDFIFPGKPTVGWSWDLLRGTLERALDRLVVGEGPSFQHGIGGKLLGLGLSGTRAGAIVSGSDFSLLEPDLKLASQLHVPVLVVHASAKGTASSGVFQLFAGDLQEALDFALICVRVAERSLLPGVCSIDSISRFDVSSVLALESELIGTFLGQPDELTEAPSPSQRMVYGDRRRRIPVLLSPRRPVGLNPLYTSMQEGLVGPGHAAYFESHLPSIASQAFDDFGALTGRFYEPVASYRVEDADYVLVAAGEAGTAVSQIVDYVRKSQRIRLGAVRVRVIRPFPSKALLHLLRGKRGITVLDRGLDDGLNLTQMVRSVFSEEAPPIYRFGMLGGEVPGATDWLSAIENMTSPDPGRPTIFVVPAHDSGRTRIPRLERMDQLLARDYPEPPWVTTSEPIPQALDAANSVRVFAQRSNVLAEIAGVVTQAAALTAGITAEGRVESGSPTAYRMHIGAATDCTGILEPDLLREDAVLRQIRPGSTVVVLSTTDKKHLWSSLPGGFRQAASDLELSVFAIRPFETANETSLAELGDQLAMGALLGAILRVALDGQITVENLEARLTEVMIREGFPSHAHGPVNNAVAHGFRQLERISRSEVSVPQSPEPEIPWTLKAVGDWDDTVFDPARFWSTVGFGTAMGRSGLLSPDPYLTSRVIPAQTSVSGAATGANPPMWLPENCTGCGLCWTLCPHSALPVAVASVADFVELAKTKMADVNESTVHVQRLGKHLAKRVHKLLADDERHRFTSLADACEEALVQLLEAAGLEAEAEEAARKEFRSLIAKLDAVTVARSDAFFHLREEKKRGSGQLLSISLDPDACTSCGICTAVCPEDAFDSNPVVSELTSRLREQREIISAVATDDEVVDAATSEFPERALAHRLIDTRSYWAALGGGRSDPGSGTKMAIHLVAAVLESVSYPASKRLLRQVSDIEERLKGRIQATLSKSIEINDFDDFAARLRTFESGGSSADVRELMNQQSDDAIDYPRLQLLTDSLLALESLRADIEKGSSGRMGSGMLAVWGNAPTIVRDIAFPLNPYPFPWINAGDSDPFAIAEGVFQGMVPDGLRAVAVLRRAHLLSEDAYDPLDEQEVTLETLEADEWSLFPTVCVFVESLDRSLFAPIDHGLPIKVFWLDRMGDAAPTDYFTLPLADPSWFLAQTVPTHPTHFLSTLLDVAKGHDPSLVRIYTPEPERDEYPSHLTPERMTRGVASRVFPLFRYRPDTALEWTQRWSLEGNQDVTLDWTGTDDGVFTPGDWSAVEGRFSKWFEVLPRTSWSETQVPLPQYLDLSSEDRSGLTPFVETEDSSGHVKRLRVTDDVVTLCRSARTSWCLLQEMAGIRSALLDVARDQVEAELRESFEAELKSVQSASEAAIADVRATYEATFRDKLAERLLAMSGFDGTSDTLAAWLRRIEEMGQSPALSESDQSL